jgi:hypothetical protein
MDISVGLYESHFIIAHRVYGSAKNHLAGEDIIDGTSFNAL